ncbi:MAG: 50S ribosomal protein L29 [Candidatus Aenigmatarchaeota archaeon]|jgi:large subunit ribosomal protein L29
MAIIKKKQLKQMSRPDLVKRLSELRLELAKDKGQIAIGGTPSNAGRFREIKKTIARILTQIKLKDVKQEVV